MFLRFIYFLGDFAPYIILLLITFSISAFSAFKIYKTDTAQTKKKIFISLLSTFALFVLGFCSFEAYFRYLYDIPDGLGFLKVSQKWTDRHVVHNNYFFRDRDFENDKRPQTIRIGVLGDSIAWGGGIENVDDRFSNRLERQLNEAGYQAEVYNLGKPGFDTDGEVGIFENVRHLNFDFIIWEYFLNDIQPVEKSTGTTIIETNRDLPAYVAFFTNKSYFLDYLYWKLTPIHQKTYVQLKQADIAQYKNEELLANHKEKIKNYLQSFKGTNTKIIAVIFPNLLVLEENNYQAEDIHKIMTEVFEKNKVEVVDLLTELRGKDGTYYMASKFDPHPNEEVHEIAAQKLFEVISSLFP